MRWRLAPVGLLAMCTQAFVPAPIQWVGLPDKRFVLAPSVSDPIRSFGSYPLMIWDRSDATFPEKIPNFIAQPDETITWDSTGLCLEAAGDKSRVWVGASQCTGRPNQLWRFVPWGHGRKTQIRLKGSHQCLAVSEKEGSLHGVPIELRDCEEKQTRAWVFEELIPSPNDNLAQHFAPLLSMRHAMISLSVMAVLGISSMSALLYRRWMKVGFVWMHPSVASDGRFVDCSPGLPIWESSCLDLRERRPTIQNHALLEVTNGSGNRAGSQSRSIMQSGGDAGGNAIMSQADDAAQAPEICDLLSVEDVEHQLQICTTPAVCLLGQETGSKCCATTRQMPRLGMEFKAFAACWALPEAHSLRVATPHMMAGKRGKPGKRSAPRKIAPKGFGAKPASTGKLLKDAAYDAMCAWLQTSPKTKLHKVAVADFDGLRGVMALEDIRVGEEIVSIPAKFSIDLGTQNQDPLLAALRLLQEKAKQNSSQAAYWELLPPPDSPDLCTADFMSEGELQLLQCPPLVSEVKRRSAQLQNEVSNVISLGFLTSFGDWMDDDLQMVPEDGLHLLKWAVWIVLSRVLTVAGPDAQGHKLLIPFIDMFNHRAGCKHYLTGRTDGTLRVVAGEKVRAGEQIHIVYGTEATSNVELLAHYGFVDPGAVQADRAVVRADPEIVDALRFSTIQEDLALLNRDPSPPYKERLALQLNVALKQAAEKEGLLRPGAANVA